MPLSDWLQTLSAKTRFWIGHFTDFNDGEVDSIVDVMLAEVEAGKPYDFWNFDLTDSSGFYCSKLVWYAVQKATGTRLDEGLTRPLPWYSPKQMHSSRYIELVVGPEDY